MTATATPDWATCAELDCSGLRLSVSDRCLGHAAEHDLVVELKRLSDGGAVDARGVPISGRLLDRILAAVPQSNDDDEQPVLRAARFDWATFEDGAEFARATFEDGAEFAGATFKGRAGFAGATFKGRAGFAGATFKREAAFAGATFKNKVEFAGATFGGGAAFAGAIFERGAWFTRATFKGGARFAEAIFKGRPWFARTIFEGGAAFDKATFKDEAEFTGSTFKGGAGFTAATFESQVWFGATFEGRAAFDKATFTGGAGFRATTFRGGAGFTAATFKDSAWFAGTAFKDWARFAQATFERQAWFTETTFEGRTAFDNATFKNKADFARAIFDSRASFAGTIFENEAAFVEATFKYAAEFAGATFETRAQFEEVTFKSEAGFAGATFEDQARFKKATFMGEAAFEVTFKKGVEFDGATFERDAEFAGATFEDRAGFEGATFEGQVGFARASFGQTQQLGPMLVRKQLMLDQANFRQGVQIEAAAGAVCCRRTQFPTGVQLRLRWAYVVLDGAGLDGPSILAGVPPFPGLNEARFNRVWARLPRPHGQYARPRLLSVRRANLAGLTVSDVDLSACRFLGAHNLDALHIEGQPLLARARGRRRTGRLSLAEEHHWRHQAPRHRSGWYPPICRAPSWADSGPSGWPTAIQLAGLYRALRKGREDSKDEPGAADFYYGEMEMRRHAAPPWSVERMLLTLYWLVAGYALRAWRAFAALLLAIVIAAGLFATVGFKPADSPRFVPTRITSSGALVYEQQPVERPSAWEQLPAALGYSAEVATSLLRGPDRPVTAVGEWTQAVLRWLGPLLFGLALVSLRGRVKR